MPRIWRRVVLYKNVGKFGTQLEVDTRCINWCYVKINWKLVLQFLYLIFQFRCKKEWPMVMLLTQKQLKISQIFIPNRPRILGIVQICKKVCHSI